MPRKIDISHKTIIFITIFILGLWVLYLIRDLLILLFVAVILMSALSPLVNFFTKLKLPKALGIIISYIFIIAAVAGILAILLPPLIEQSNRLISALPPLLADQFNLSDVNDTVFQSQLVNLSKNIFSITLEVFSNLITVIFVLVLTFYLLLEKESLEEKTPSLFGERSGQIRKSIIRIEEKLGAWVRGQLFLSIIIGLLVYLGLIILNIPYALPLALLAAIMEVVPVIGPIIAAIPAVILALTISPVITAAVVGWYFIIQQLENNLIVPQVMKRAVGLNPLIIILAVAVGTRLLGFGGALLAVPIVVVLQVVWMEVLEEKSA